MTRRITTRPQRDWCLAIVPALAILLAIPAQAATGARTEIYGHVMLDMGYQTGQNDPDWFDVLRPTKLPAYDKEFGEDGRFFSSVRQTRFGVKSFLPTERGELMTIFEFELFGTGPDAGQTTFRLRHAYGELGRFGAGQYWSPFMDIDVFPNSLEYWGPNAMVFFRNIQLRWMPIKGDTRLTVALERPGASADGGRYGDRIELENVQSRFPLPDLSAEYRWGRSWGYVELAGIARYIEWDDTLEDEYDLSGDTIGWGLNLSSNVKLGGHDTLRLQFVYGEGIQNYMNDATADIGIEENPGDERRPIEGKALPLFGAVAFLDHAWNERFSTAIGYSHLNIDNSDGQADDAFKTGQYALGNLLYHPVPSITVGAEVQYGRRENFDDGWDTDDVRIQFSVKYQFAQLLGGK